MLQGGAESRRHIANTEVIWTCTGAAWIDQGGNLHVRGAGTAHVVALVRGVSISADYKVIAAKPAEGPNPGGPQD